MEVQSDHHCFKFQCLCAEVKGTIVNDEIRFPPSSWSTLRTSHNTSISEFYTDNCIDPSDPITLIRFAASQVAEMFATTTTAARMMMSFVPPSWTSIEERIFTYVLLADHGKYALSDVSSPATIEA
eukprot:scaffold9013_cov121-Alexandrium_tamarense.AAC.3